MSEQPKKKKSRLVKLLLGVFVILVLLALIGPTLAAPVVRSRVVAAIEDSLYAQASLEKLSFGWSGAARLSGLVLTEETGEPLASVDQLALDIGVLGLIRGRYELDVDLDGFEVHVRQDEDGAWNLARIVREAEDVETEDDDEEEPATAPDLHARIAVANGRVVLHGRDGRTELHDLALRAEVDGLDQPADLFAFLAVHGPEGPAGEVQLDGSLTLASENELDPLGVEGELELDVRNVLLDAFAPAATLAGSVDELAGTLAGGGRVTIRKGLALDGEGKLQASALRVSGPQAQTVAIESIVLAGSADSDAEGAGTHELSLQADDFFTLSYDGQAKLPAEGAGEIGGRLTLEGDVAGLTRVASGWVPWKEGLSFAGRLQGSQTLSGSLDSREPRIFSFEGGFDLEGLTARDEAGQPVDLGELSEARLALRASADLEQGSLSVPRVEAKAGSLELAGVLGVSGWGRSRAEKDGEGAGTISLDDSELTLKADLNRLRNDLARIVELGGTDFGGTLEATLRGSQDGDRASLRGDVTVRAFHYATAEDPESALRIEELTARTDLVYDTREDSLELPVLRVASGPLDLEGSGSFQALRSEERSGTIRGELELVPAALTSAAAELLDGLRLEGEPLTGTLAANINGADTRVTAIFAGDELTLSSAEEGVPARTQRNISLDVEVRTQGEKFQVEHARYAADGIQTSVTGTFSGVESEATKLELTLAGELATVLADLGLEAPEGGRSTRGALTGTASLTGGAESVNLKGGVRVDGFELELDPGKAGPETAAAGADGPSRPVGEPWKIAEPSIKLDFDADYVPESEDVLLHSVELRSGFARGRVQGNLRNLAALAAEDGAGEIVLESITGELTYVPDQLGAVLAPLLPGTLSGAEEERLAFELNGAASELDMLSLLAGSQGTASLGLGRFQTAGFDLGGDLKLEVHNGRTVLVSDLTANGGTLGISGTLDLSPAREGEDPPRSVLEVGMIEVEANSGLSPLLSLVHPAFAVSERVGQGSLGGILDCELQLSYDGPLTAEQLTGGWAALPKANINGQGKLALKGAALEGAPLLNQALGRIGLDLGKSLDLEPIEFQIQNGRLGYLKPWQWTIDGTQTTFSGTIGLDKTLDLSWNVPIGDELVGRYDFLDALRGETVRVPLRGSVTKPELAWEGLLSDLVQRAAKKELENRLNLGDLLGGGKKGDGEEKQEKRDDPANLLREADKLWEEGKKVEAAAIYERIRKEFEISLVYALNKSRIKRRSKYVPEDDPKSDGDP